ncbi:PREDICTED: uncharacterized protein LOC109238409 [Nicotiana attenuata]|uniref:uncharacterized protein LOC109238409 n=1 Tax=Nicotiana attenuata TaxID=49451 RepID=UPI000904FACF|nr:PREDICTED: uncharacterized protein LOC109238409 [Nicotiana attenuata]
MTIKLVVGGHTLNIISAYAPQEGLDEEVKRCFWEDLDEMMRDILHTEKLFIGGDFNGHIGATSRGYDDVHGGFGAWRSSGDSSATWTVTVQCIKETTREILGVSKGHSGGHKGDWWWTGEVQGKVKTKKETYLNLVESVDEEEKRANREHYKLDKKEAKLGVTAAKTATFSNFV